MKLLILSNVPGSSSVKKLVNEAEKRKHEVDVVSPLDFVPYISSTKSGHDHMYVKNDVGDVKRMFAKSYDVVLPRFSGRETFAYGLALLQHFSGNLGVPVASDPLAMSIASNKFSSHQVFSVAKIRSIPTLFTNQPVDFSFIVRKLGLPLVCKTPLGSQGSGVFILTDELSVSTTLSAFARTNKNLLLQKFINTGNPKSDLRVFVVDGQIVAAYKRWALASDFRSNYSLSKSGENANLTNEEKEMAIDTAYAVGLPGICGVDLCRDADNGNRPYVIEANGNPSLSGVTAVTGVNVAGHIISYCERISRKSSSGSGENTSGTKNHLQLFSAGGGFPVTMKQINEIVGLSDTNQAINFLKN